MAPLQTEELERLVDGAIRDAAGATHFEEAAQALVGRLFDAYRESIVLARAYVTVPFAALPERNAGWVKELAEAKGVAGELSDSTPVISLVGSAGRREAWNDRRASQGHVGIPMVSASFIDAIPMMSRLMASLGGDLAWIDEGEAESGVAVSRLGRVAGTFYVGDASTQKDAQGRIVISATDFVAEHGVKTVFGLGGAFASGQILVVLVFCSEHIPIEAVERLRAPLIRFKVAAARLLGDVFSGGGRILRSLPPREEGAARRTGNAELDALSELYLELEWQLEQRTRDLELILDSSGDGLVMVDFDGTAHGRITASARTWFGHLAPGEPVAEYLFGKGSREAGTFEVGLDQIASGLLPFEVSSGQMPRRFMRGFSDYEITYQPVLQKQRLVGVLLVIRDISAQIIAERAEARTRELSVIVSNIVADRANFEGFVAEATRLIDGICESESATDQLRDLHTLKGIAGMFGFQSLATLAHAQETESLETGAPLDPRAQGELHEAWTSALAMVSEFVGGAERKIEITVTEHEELLGALEGGATRSELAEIVRGWRHDRVGRPLGRLAKLAQSVGARLGKPIDVVVDDGGVRAPTERMAPLWSSLVHVVRNAADHGIEPAAEREAAGKSPRGRVELRCARERGRLVVTISDDGRGIDWPKVREKARAAGLPCATHADLTESLFTDGVTTSEDVTELSGRGVGLAAVRSACDALGAAVEIESVYGQGTIVWVTLPPVGVRLTSVPPARRAG